MPSSVERRQKILKLLQEQEFLRTKDLIDLFQVSPMTLHRDLSNLARSGMASKVHGGVTIAEKYKRNEIDAGKCALCNKPDITRTAFILYSIDGEKVPACCPHCGLLLLAKLQTVSLALTTDFLSGQMVNAQYATYLIDCAVNCCCVPCVLSFASREDAHRFQQGFGGQAMNFMQTRHHLQKLMLSEESFDRVPGDI